MPWTSPENCCHAYLVLNTVRSGVSTTWPLTNGDMARLKNEIPDLVWGSVPFYGRWRDHEVGILSRPVPVMASMG